MNILIMGTRDIPCLISMARQRSEAPTNTDETTFFVGLWGDDVAQVQRRMRQLVKHRQTLRSKARPTAGRLMCSPQGCVVCGYCWTLAANSNCASGLGGLEGMPSRELR
ncbi:MAG: hypothetical protein HYU74_00170 [Dechloromonas sp.]|nr:hypothetical protein [Dechloromonas sp.]